MLVTTTTMSNLASGTSFINRICLLPVLLLLLCHSANATVLGPHQLCSQDVFIALYPPYAPPPDYTMTENDRLTRSAGEGYRFGDTPFSITEEEDEDYEDPFAQSKGTTRVTGKCCLFCGRGVTQRVSSRHALLSFTSDTYAKTWTVIGQHRTAGLLLPEQLRLDLLGTVETDASLVGDDLIQGLFYHTACAGGRFLSPSRLARDIKRKNQRDTKAAARKASEELEEKGGNDKLKVLRSSPESHMRTGMNLDACLFCQSTLSQERVRHISTTTLSAEVISKSYSCHTMA